MAVFHRPRRCPQRADPGWPARRALRDGGRPPAEHPRWRSAMPVPRLPLVVTGDPDLLDDLLRLAAAGGSEVDVAADPAAARPRYAAAPLVVIGLDQLEPCLRARLPRRSRVIVTARGPVSTTDYEVADRLGVEHVTVLPLAEPWVVDRFAERFDPATAGRILAVIGGRGGAGASILA